jgi:hypothetical protein
LCASHSCDARMGWCEMYGLWRVSDPYIWHPPTLWSYFSQDYVPFIHIIPVLVAHESFLWTIDMIQHHMLYMISGDDRLMDLCRKQRTSTLTPWYSIHYNLSRQKYDCKSHLLTYIRNCYLENFVWNVLFLYKRNFLPPEFCLGRLHCTT